MKALLLPFGYSDKELSESGVDDLLAMIEEEVQRLQAQVMVPTIKGVEKLAQRVVPNADLPKLFEEGWRFKASLGDGQSIVESPAGDLLSRRDVANLVKTAEGDRTSKEN